MSMPAGTSSQPAMLPARKRLPGVHISSAIGQLFGAEPAANPAPPPARK